MLSLILSNDIMIFCTNSHHGENTQLVLSVASDLLKVAQSEAEFSLVTDVSSFLVLEQLL